MYMGFIRDTSSKSCIYFKFNRMIQPQGEPCLLMITVIDLGNIVQFRKNTIGSYGVTVQYSKNYLFFRRYYPVFEKTVRFVAVTVRETKTQSILPQTLSASPQLLSTQTKILSGQAQILSIQTKLLSTHPKIKKEPAPRWSPRLLRYKIISQKFEPHFVSLFVWRTLLILQIGSELFIFRIRPRRPVIQVV